MMLRYRPLKRSEERFLVRRAQEGDRGAMTQLLEGSAAHIRALANHNARNREDREDLTQELFATAIEVVRKFDPDHGVRLFSYMTRPLIWRLLVLKDKRKRRAPYAAVRLDQPQEDGRAWAYEPTTNNTERSLKAREEADAVADLLRTLPVRTRMILAHKYGLFGRDEITLKEIGERLGISKARVGQLHRDALKDLRGFHI